MLRLQPERERLQRADQMIESMVRRSLRERRQARESDAMSFRLLVERRLASEDAQLAQLRSGLRALARERSRVAMRALDEHRKSLHKTCGRSLERHRERLTLRQERLVSPTALNRLSSEKRRLDTWKQVLRLADPARVLERGYALLYAEDGTLVRTGTALREGELVTAQLVDSRVSARVESVATSDSPKSE
jgi:exodeoxyribonuclease VII large subunit